MTSSFPPFSYPPLGGVVLLLLAAVCFPNVRAHSQHDGEHHAGLRHHHAEGCGHDEFKNLPGYGVNAPVIHANYPVNTSHRDASTGHRGFTTTAVTYGSIRITLFFDQGDCTGGTTTCGHCTAVGQTVTTFESTTATTVCAADDVLTDAKKSYIMDTLMAGAVAFYSTAISVIPVSGNLVVTGGSTCGTGPGTPVPSAHRSTGVANTDLILYVTAVPKQDRTSAVVAWATACRVDAAGRTLVGQVNFIPAKLTNADSPIATSTDSDTKVAIHEICHALGYSAPFYGSYGYLDTDGATWVSGGTTTAYSTSLSKSVTYINSPRVLREVRNHFGCQTLLGAEIEDQGGSGTSGTHWEKRIFYQSTMAGIVSSVTPFHDRFMLAFLEDTGHYVADYTVADPRLQWGKGKGCTFATALCNTISTTKASSNLEFCFDSSQSNSYCTYDRLGRGYCDVSQFSSVPSANQYFTNTALGASVYLADYCPAVLPYSNQICIEPTIVDKNNIFGNTYSANSRCFDSNLISVDYSSSSSSTQTRCFPVICLVGRLILKIGGQQVLCPSGGAAGSADTSAISNSYQGSITCPAASVFGCTTSSSGTLSSSFTATPSPPTTTASTPGSNAPGATGAGSGSGPTTTTTAAPTATPLIEGGLLPFTTPAAPTASCADRVPCASAAFSLLPRCRKVAAAVQKCFARDCDTQMENFFAAIGVTPNCSTSVTKNSFAASCEEGMAGVYDLCQLADANAVRVLSITLGATVVALFVYLL